MNDEHELGMNDEHEISGAKVDTQQKKGYPQQVVKRSHAIKFWFPSQVQRASTFSGQYCGELVMSAQKSPIQAPFPASAISQVLLDHFQKNDDCQKPTN